RRDHARLGLSSRAAGRGGASRWRRPGTDRDAFDNRRSGLGMAETEAPQASPSPPRVEVVHLDDDFAVIDKPAGLVVHPAASHRGETLVDQLADLLAGGPDPDRPGIVHRLDRDTSGLMVVARTEKGYEALLRQ